MRHLENASGVFSGSEFTFGGYQALFRRLSLDGNMVVKVELLGLCGAGKTTFLNAIIPMLKSNVDFDLTYPYVPPKIQILLNVIRILWVGFFTEPIIFSRFIAKKNNWWLIKKIAYRSAGINCRKEDSAILIDSGILQPFISFEIEENSSDITVPIHPILNGCALPDVVIVFDVAPSIAIERYKQRGLCGEGMIIRENSETHFNRAEKLRKNLVKYCKMKNVQIVEVNSSQEFNERYLTSKLVEIRKFNKKEKM